MPADELLFESHIEGYPCHRGKVRDVYDLGDRLIIIATDRISAFDWVLPTAIPGKGKILCQLSIFWFQKLGFTNHLISTDIGQMPLPFQAQSKILAGRTMMVKKTKVIPFECVARGYLSGSGWKEYQQSQSICGISLRKGMLESQTIEPPIFTPATKAESGHDENVSFESMVNSIGELIANELRDRTLAIYSKARQYARTKGILIADTKLEWGQLPNGEIILIDEVLTPDSSRFWPIDQYRIGNAQPSFDKQFIRNWLESSQWDKNSKPPEIPQDIVDQTRSKYIEAYERLTGLPFSEPGS